MFVKYVNKPNRDTSKFQRFPNGLYLQDDSPVFKTIQNWFLEHIRERSEVGQKPHPAIKKLVTNGILIAVSQNDFINKSSYKGFCTLYKCNSQKPKYHKKYCGKDVGMVSILGFKITDYDTSINYLLVSKMEFLHSVVEKQISEFPMYPEEFYLGDDDVNSDFEYDRCWEKIGGLTPQEKIILAMVHNEEPFPNSFYENDSGRFNARTVEREHIMNEQTIINEIQRENDIDEIELNNLIDENIEDYYSSVKEGFDYGSWEFSDLYTTTKTQIEDYELYPIRVNCLPKSGRKKGKSPYDTKLGIREYRWFNNYQKKGNIDDWKDIPEVKELWRQKEIAREARKRENESKRMADQDEISDEIWAEIEKAYQMR